MKFRYLSDLHLEFIQPQKLQRLVLDKIIPAEDGEVCILAGDIGNPYSSNYDDFMKFISGHFVKSFVILGNHEYYQKEKTMNEVNLFLEDYFKQYPNISFLNNKYETYGEYCFVGSIMWSYIKDPMFQINDVYKIPDFDYKKYNELNRVCVEFLESSLTSLTSLTSENEKKNCILITHHLPSSQFIHSKYKTIQMKPYNQWFYCNMDSFIEKHKNKIKCWFFGHTHTPSIDKVSDITFLCNPIGYPGENNKTDLNKQFLLE